MKWSRTTQFRATSGLPIVLDPAPAGERGRVGVEHEYRLWNHAEQTDFRVLLPLVAGDLRCLDPGDPRARRLPSGVALTADGLEAELATPPVRVGPGVGRTLDLMLAAERSILAAEAREHAVTSLTGFSTHVNVGVPDSEVVTVARRLANECAVAIGLLAEPSDSSGLLVRPRRGRLEVGGEYAEGSDLEVLVTVLLAAVRGLRTGAGPAGQPPPVLEPSREKFGWYLPAAGWPTGGAARTAISDFWTWARPHALALGLDPQAVDVLADSGPLRSQSQRPTEACSVEAPGAMAPPAYDTRPRTRPSGVVAETVWLTWQHAVWRCARDRGVLHAVVDADQEAEFLRRLDEGEYDQVLARELRRGARTRSLVVNAQLVGPSWWHRVRPGALVPAERLPDGSLPRVSVRRARRAMRRDGW